MKRQLITITVDAATKRDLDKLASEEGRSSSDIFREMYNYYMFKRALRRVQDYGERIAARLGLETEDDVYEYLSKDKHGRSQQGRAGLEPSSIPTSTLPPHYGLEVMPTHGRISQSCRSADCSSLYLNRFSMRSARSCWGSNCLKPSSRVFLGEYDGSCPFRGLPDGLHWPGLAFLRERIRYQAP